jgi:hypothetical protein
LKSVTTAITKLNETQESMHPDIGEQGIQQTEGSNRVLAASLKDKVF